MKFEPKIGRQQFRRYKRGEMSVDELKDLVARMAEAAAEEMLETHVYNMNMLVRAGNCLLLHDKYGFGKKRLTEYLIGLDDLMDSYASGYLDIDDMEKTVEEECKIIFVNRKDGEENGIQEKKEG